MATAVLVKTSCANMEYWKMQRRMRRITMAGARHSESTDFDKQPWIGDTLLLIVIVLEIGFECGDAWISILLSSID